MHSYKQLGGSILPKGFWRADWSRQGVNHQPSIYDLFYHLSDSSTFLQQLLVFNLSNVCNNNLFIVLVYISLTAATKHKWNFKKDNKQYNNPI